MRLFHLNRKVDVSGISGVGRVAEGVEFDDGQVVLSWFGRYHTVEILPHIKAVTDLHGHDEKTIVEWVEHPKETTT